MLLFYFADVRAGFWSKSSNLLKPNPFPPSTLNFFSLEFNPSNCKSPPPFITEHVGIGHAIA